MNVYYESRLSTLLIGVIFVLFTFQYAKAGPELSSGEFTKQHVMHSAVLEEDRVFSVCLPASYDIVSEHYPVLIILDGEDFLRPFAGMVEYYSRIGRCPELIVVGIHSEDRWRDYTPTHASVPDGTPLPTSGRAGLFLKFINDELLPFIESTYRLAPFRVLYGHSIAGLFVVSAVFDELSQFSGYIATSPSLWWDDELVTRESRSSSKPPQGKSRLLFFTIGSEDSTMLGPMLRFVDAMEKQPNQNIDWKFKRFEGVDHQTMPIKSFAYGLEYVFGDWQMPEHLYKDGLTAIVGYFDRLSSKYLQKIVPRESILNRLGYMALKDGNYEEAIRIFKLNVDTYPLSANVYDSLGEAFLTAGDSTNAVVNYEKSLELNPENRNAEKILLRLKSRE
jgi:predicted alpha/beta superfamily hydrolase